MTRTRVDIFDGFSAADVNPTLAVGQGIETLETEDATSTPLLTLETSTDGFYLVQLYIIARSKPFATDTNSWWFSLLAADRTNGALTPASLFSVLSSFSASHNHGIGRSASGNDQLLVNVRGVADTDVLWKCEYKIFRGDNA